MAKRGMEEELLDEERDRARELTWLAGPTIATQEKDEDWPVEKGVLPEAS